MVASRLLSAVGYRQPPVYYLPSWTLSGGPSPGSQTEARFRPKRNYLEGFERHGFLKRVKDGRVLFEFRGLQKELIHDISADDVRWMCSLLGRLSRAQMTDAFRAANYSTDVADRFIHKLEEKISAGRG